MVFETVIKILGGVFGLFGSIYQIMQFTPVRKQQIKNDIEILEKLEKDSTSYDLVKDRIDTNIQRLYSQEGNNKIIKSPDDFIFGILFFIGFTIWSVFLYYKSQGFNWWILLTGFFALIGIGGLMNGLGGKKSKN